MLQKHHPSVSQPQVRYFYMPASDGKAAEIIAIVNSDSDVIRIPIPEEDVILQAFFQRDVTAYETARFGEAATWRIFNSWEKLETDHARYNVCLDVMKMLLICKAAMPLQEQYAMAKA